MEYLVKIDDTPEAKPLIAHLKTLKYVKIIKKRTESIVKQDAESIPLKEAIEISKQWKIRKR
ncbi:MAG: hypothetical protein IIA88_00210 [Bacteroidetes bacterium]|nr:hypothetical protein [Bacteroidota bacterium]